MKGARTSRRGASTRTPRRPVRAGARLGGLLAACAAGAAVVVFLVAPTSGGPAGAAGSLAGSQGIVTSLGATSSAVTVSGSGSWSGLKVTVNQTKNLVDQAVSVSWTGGQPTQSTDEFESDYLQIFECWGDPQNSDPADPNDPGPLPTQCQFGAESDSSSSYPVSGPGFEYSRVLSQPSWSSYDSTQGWTDPSTGYKVEPFEAVNGTVVDQQADYNYDANPNNPQPFWLEPYFRYGTSNEVDFARTYANGTGTQLFQVQTGLNAPGLGCGQSLQPVPGGGTKVPQCWIVVVPRGTPAQENPSGLEDESVMTSPLTAAAWAHRIAIPIYFNPVGTSCSITAQADQIEGGELASEAVSSWEPALCSLPGSPSYSYIENTDDQARQNLLDPTYGSAGMSVYSLPPSESQVASAGDVVEAPLTLSGVVVAFNIQRVPGLLDGESRADESALAGDQVEHIYLTPRLMAKLLTQSYQAELQDVTSSKSKAYAWVQHNPTDLFTDPDFLQYNPEFRELSTTQAVDASTLVVEEPSSDAAAEVWKWILSDPAAAAWLAGSPDPWGMTVNPYYSTNPKLNPSGESFASTVSDTYPKSDPWCYSTGDDVTGPPAEPATPLCIINWSPYALSMQAAAEDAGAATDGAKTTFNPAGTPDTAWGSNPPQVTGTHFVMTITDSASAARYGLQTASLSRAGDDGPNPVFIAPDNTSLTLGEQSFVQSPVPGVLEPDRTSSTGAGAYPLTMLTYAALRPVGMSAQERSAYATFIQYASGTGQTPGSEPGQLPAGYVPLPGSLRLQDLAAVNAILNPPSGKSGTTSASPAGSGGSVSAGLPSSPATTTSSSNGASSSSSTPGAKSTVSRPKAVRSAVVGLVRSSGFLAGMLRFALPALLALGLGAMLAAAALGRIRRRPATAGGDPTTDLTTEATDEAGTTAGDEEVPA